MGRGSRRRRHRAAWRLIRNAVASSHQSCRAGLVRTYGAPRVGSRRTAGACSRATVRVSPPLASPRAAWRVARKAGLSRPRSSAIAHSSGRPTSKWSRRARRSGAMVSPQRAAHLQRWTDGQETKNRIKSDHENGEEIASGCSAHRGSLDHVGVRFARTGTLGQRRAVGVSFGWRRQLGSTSRRRSHILFLDLWVVRSRRCPRRTSWLFRTAARQRRRPRRSRHGRCGLVVQRPAIVRSSV